MYIKITCFLFVDPQDIPPAAFCPVCGGACYDPGRECLRCRRRMP